MGDLIRLPVPSARTSEDEGFRNEEPHLLELRRLPAHRLRSWARTATTMMRCRSSRRPNWNGDDRRLFAATNPLLADRAPRGVPLSLNDARALHVAIVLRNLHPGGGAPTPNYVDHTARRLRTLQRAIGDDPRAPDVDDADAASSPCAGTDTQLVQFGS